MSTFSFLISTGMIAKKLYPSTCQQLITVSHSLTHSLLLLLLLLLLGTFQTEAGHTHL